MKTDDLIKGLAADTTPQMPQGRAWWVALALAVVIAAIIFFGTMGVRPDFAAAAETVRFLFKFVVTIILAATAWLTVRALSAPGANQRKALLPLIAAPAILLAAVALELMVLPAAEIAPRMIGKNAMICLAAVPAIGLIPLGIFIAALRYGAPGRPGVAGMVAGVLAGAVAATFYAAHCTDDSPLFVVVWYTFAIAILAGAGALAGKLAARW